VLEDDQVVQASAAITEELGTDAAQEYLSMVEIKEIYSLMYGMILG
jgi:hypothetical protein